MNTRAARFLSQFSRWVSGLAILFGVVVLTGWAFHIPRFKAIVAGQVAVKVNTAICFLLIGLVLWWSREPGVRRFRKRLSAVMALTASVIGLLSFLECLYGWDLGIDQLLFRAGVEDIPGSVRPGLMSPITAADFFLLGIALPLLDSSSLVSRWLRNLFASVAAVASVFGILDFVLDPQNTHTHIAPTTALILLLFSFALLCARTQSGLGALLVSSSSGGELSRRLLPASILIPIAIAWLPWRGQQLGLFSEWTGVVIMTVSAGLLLSGFILWTAFVLNRLDAERRKAEESTRNLAAVVNASSDGIIGKTMDGIVTSWNPGAEATYGYSAAEMIGQSMTRLVPDDRLDEFQSFLERLQQGENIRHYETERTRKDGTKIWVSLSTSPIRDQKGDIVGASTITRDITDRKLAAAAIDRSERRYRSLVTATSQIVWTTNAQGEVVEDMPLWRDFTGMTVDEIKGSGWLHSLHPDDRLRIAEVWREAVRHRSHYDVEYRIRSHDGEYRDFSVRGVPVIETDGGIREWVGTCTDITDRKRAEAEILALNRDLEKRVEQRTAELRQSEQRVRRKLDCILTPEGDLGQLNLADIIDVTGIQSLAEDFSSLTGIPVGIIDLEGKPLVGAGWQEICTKFHRLHPETCKNCIESDTVLSQGVASGEFKLYKCKNNLWDGVTPLTLAGKHVGNCFIGQFFLNDETVDRELFRKQAKQYGFDESAYLAALDRVPRLSRAQLKPCSAFFTKFAQLLSQLSYSSVKLARSSEQLTRVNTDLTTAVKELESFSYSVAHDLRAPLRHMSGFSQILMEEFGSQLPPEARHYLERIDQGTIRMGQLVDDLLNLARVGRTDLALQLTGLSSVVEEVISALKPEIGDRHVEWKIGPLPFVECDPALIKQVFQNLLSNALKFTRPRAHATIEIGQRTNGEAPEIFVRDNGVGFSMKYADKLFGVFQRLHRPEDFEGTGVGLATVQRILQKHGGRIWADAELDKGAAFYFTLGQSEKTEIHPPAVAAGAYS